jgi:hypothetical protein
MHFSAWHGCTRKRDFDRSHLPNSRDSDSWAEKIRSSVAPCTYLDPLHGIGSLGLWIEPLEMN